MTRFVADIFPSDFAVSLAKACELIRDKDRGDINNDAEIAEERKMIGFFQHMVIGGCSFDEALVVFQTRNLSENQIEMLRIIEKATKPFIYGHLSELLLKKANSGSYTAIATLLTEVMSRKDGAGKVPFEKARGLIIKMASDSADLESE